MYCSLAYVNALCPTLQVLDLGVTRLLVHRLVQICPSLCDGHDPLCGSFVATYAESNARLQFLGRRCRATLAGSAYVWPPHAVLLVCRDSV